MVNFKFEMRKLIKLVERRPVIWDRTFEGYRNSKLTKAAWQEIYVEIIPDYPRMDEDQKNEYGKLVSNKWTQTRDMWQKSLKRRRECQLPEPDPESKEGIRHRDLKFLLKLYKNDPDRSSESSHNDNRPTNVDPEADTILNSRLEEINFRQPYEVFRPTPSSSKQTSDLQSSKKNTSHSSQNTNHHTNHRNQERRKLTKVEAQELQQYISDIIIDVDDDDRRNEKEPLEYNSSVECGNNTNDGASRSLPHSIKMENVEVMYPTVTIKEENQQPSSSHQTDDESSDTKAFNPRKRHREDDWRSDEINSFLGSIAHRVGNFDEAQYLDFQMGVLQLIKRIKYPERK